MFGKIFWRLDWNLGPPMLEATALLTTPQPLPKIIKSCAVVVVEWSVCSPSTLTIRGRIPLNPTVFSVKFVFEKNENKWNEAGGWPFLKKDYQVFNL